MSRTDNIAPFPYFGGKRTIAADVWQRLGHPRQYIEPFCGSAAMLLMSRPASLEVVKGHQHLRERTKTKASECVWFSPACDGGAQGSLFS